MKDVVSQKAGELEADGIHISKMRIQAKTKSEGEFGAGGTLSILPIELDISQADAMVNTIDVSLVPVPAKVKTLSIDQDLGKAIDTIVHVARSAALTAPEFELNEGKVAFEFGVTRKGGIKFIFGGKKSNQTTHLFELTLSPVK